MAKHSLENIWNWDIGFSMTKDAPSLTDRVETEELPARVASLRELAALLAETSRDLRAAQRLVLCAAKQIERETQALGAGAEPDKDSPSLTSDPNSRPLLRINEVASLLGVDRSTLYVWRRKGQFVQPVQISSGRKGYLRHEVEEWLRNEPRV